MNRIAKVLLAVVCVAAGGRLAQAADNGTEFGVEDDLTVLGKAGTAVDPDVEIKGFTVFGSTQTSYLIPVDTGNVVMNGIVQVSSGLYVAGSSTFAAGAYFTDISSFSDVSKVHFGGGTVNQVLKKVPGGGMVWGDDNLGAGEITGTPRRLVMFQTDGGGGSDSLLQQNTSDLGVTLISGSSLTINGPFESTGTVKLGNTGAAGIGGVVIAGVATVGGTLGVTGASSLSTLGTSGLATLNSASITTTLGVTGAATLSNDLSVAGNAQLGDNITDSHSVNRAVEAGVALSVDGTGTSGGFVTKFYSNNSLAAWIKKK